MQVSNWRSMRLQVSEMRSLFLSKVFGFRPWWGFGYRIRGNRQAGYNCAILPKSKRRFSL